ncbi:MAG: chromosome segregation protein SMC [Clostridia bacterium]|nr:chromosome segregation protein SMC [Clostridia bacterium]
MLNFVKIELRGFKSFADKVEIPFKEGVTAIIGPNGCGKSNVAEAIRWTLGEQSAKQLRGKSMQDVIFAGTEKRKSMSYCEVSLTFANEGQRLFKNIPYEEVVITRKIYRDGKPGEYFINNTPCRLKDITSMLRDTGIGKEGYSIIGQGRVAEIMSAKPEDRRHIFEEAAGISKFRAQRNEAESKLEKTTLNLQTANEVIAEIEKQITPLRKQAETAQKYFELKEQLKHNEVNLYIYNYDNVQNVKQKILTRISAYANELKLKDKEYQEVVAKYDKLMLELSSIDEKYENDNAELLALKVDAERVAGAANVLKERIANLQSEISRLNGELAEIDAQLVANSTLIVSTQEKKEQKFKEYLDVSKEASELEAKLSKLSESIEGQESSLEKSNAEYVHAVESLSELKNNLTGYSTEKGICEARAKSLLELLNEKKKKLDAANTDLAIFNGNVRTSKDKLKELVEKYNEALSDKLDAQEAIKAFDEDVVSLNSRLGMAEGNLKLLKQSKEDYQGYQEAVQRLMQDAKHDPVVKSKILGLLAEVMKVPQDYEAAIEYALGGAMQNVLVETEKEASDLINYLKQKNYGRVTFRPLTACRPHGLDPKDLGVLNEPGCFGLASELVSVEKRFMPFVEALLGATVVVNNIDNATRIYKKYNQAFRIVTLDGEIFTRAGEITGGSRRNQTKGLLAQEKNIENAEATLEKIKDNISKLSAQRQARADEIVECEGRLEKVTKELSEVRVEINLNEEKSKQAFDSSESLQLEIKNDSIEYEKLRAQIDDLQSKIAQINKLEDLAKEKKEEYNALLQMKDKNVEQKSEREIVADQVLKIRIRLAEQKAALDSCDSDLFRFTTEKEGLESEKLDLIADITNAQSNLNLITNAPERTSFTPEDEARIKALETEIASLSERKRAISDELVELDRSKTTLVDERSSINEKKIKDEAMLDNVDIDIRNQQEHILEEYNLTYASALEFKDEEFKAHGAQTVITELKRAIGRLGDVNPLALETLKETEARLEEQTSYRDDIQKAYDDILTVIKELTGEMKEKFLSAFTQINENFKEVFVQLFGGGKGELRLDTKETDDVLEAGIEIFAQPPGKKLQHISLLSGGEQAYTAISILFAILKLKPMPFCVLDEIEAALDDANINLFAEFLKKFSDYTQFIVITHRKPTMRHADTIFGVTMEEKGVTKIVSIEFEEADKYAQKPEQK